MSLVVSRVGKAIAGSGLHPVAVNQLLTYLAHHSQGLRSLLFRDDPSKFIAEDDFEFVVLHAILGSAEFDPGITYRFLPYQFLQQELSGPQGKLRPYLTNNERYDVTNAAVLAYRWIQGVNIGSLESTLDVRSGVLTALFAETAAVVRGLADVIFSASSQRPGNALPTALSGAQAEQLSVFVAPFRELARRLIGGVPGELLWMTELEVSGKRMLARAEIVALQTAGIVTPDEMIDGGKKADVLQALGSVSARRKAKASNLIEAARAFKCDARTRLMDSQIRRLGSYTALIKSFYESRDKPFEACVDRVWSDLTLNVLDRDDDTKSLFPDFIVEITNGPDWAVECKSKQNMGYVPLSDATAVISKASANGHGPCFKVTICQPFLSTDVPRKIKNCTELSVVNA